MLVTTTYTAPLPLCDYAAKLASELGAVAVPRKKFSLQKLRTIHRTEDILIAAQDGLRYVSGNNPPLFFHPSMANVRVKRLMNGEKDSLVEYSGVQEGDTVLDCTAGLGSDAIVFSFAAGRTGRVVALESESPLYVLLREGLRHYHSDMDPLNEAMRRICIEFANHNDYLSRLQDKSVDVIYFDPMFRQSVDHSSAIQPLRGTANPHSVDPGAIVQAKRVARKSVVLKEHRDSSEFCRLGFDKIYKSYSKVAYGVIEL